jgi:hypothetical protein
LTTSSEFLIASYISLHQNIGLTIGLGALATIGLATTRALAIGILPAVLFLLFHIASKNCAAFARTEPRLSWLRSLLGSLQEDSSPKHHSSLHSRDNRRGRASSARASRIQSQRERPPCHITHHTGASKSQPWISHTDMDTNPSRIASEPRLLLFGRGIGLYPLDEGAAPPDWLLNPKATACT